MTKLDLSSILTEDALKSAAGARSFAAGQSYCSAHCVKEIEEVDDVITARVAGTEKYRVRLWVQNGSLNSNCSCPFAADGNFCKHMVATGLAWLAGQHKQPQGRGMTLSTIREYLNSLDKTEVIQLLITAVSDNDALFNRLALSAAHSSPAAPDIDALRSSIDRAAHLDDYLEYREVYEYANGLEDIVAALSALGKDGNASDTVDLCEYAIAAIEENMEYLDDSSGSVGGVISELGNIHRSACASAVFDQEELATRLFELEMTSEFAFQSVLAEYEEVLGGTGLEAYARIVTAEWANISALGPGAKGSYDAKRSRLSHIMESFAEQSGDVDVLISVKSRDLSSSYRYASIAEILREAERTAEALQWVERGLAAFPSERNSQLTDLLVKLYNDLGRHDDAIQVAWDLFEKSPSLGGIQYLQEQAQRNGSWERWRSKAITALYARVEREERQRDRWARGRDELVNTLLWLGDAEAAWKEMVAGSVPANTRLKVAEAREVASPDDSLKIYREILSSIVEATTNGRYDEPAQLLRKIQDVLQKTGRAAEFPRELSHLRLAFKRKRNFMLEIDGIEREMAQAGVKS